MFFLTAVCIALDIRPTMGLWMDLPLYVPPAKGTWVASEEPPIPRFMGILGRILYPPCVHPLAEGA